MLFTTGGVVEFVVFDGMVTLLVLFVVVVLFLGPVVELVVAFDGIVVFCVGVGIGVGNGFTTGISVGVVGWAAPEPAIGKYVT